jgi:hypothetical protein
MRFRLPAGAPALLNVAAVCAVLMAVPRPLFAQGPPFTFTPIVVPGAVHTEPTSINNSGRIVGTYFDTSAKPHGFLYESGTFTTIDYPGSPETYLFSISHTGKILGSYFISAGFYGAFILENGTYTPFNVLGADSDAQSINSSGQIIGMIDAGIGTPVHGYIKNGEQITQLDYPGATDTGAFGLTDTGVAVGTYKTAGLRHGYVYTAGSCYSVDFPGAAETTIAGINNSYTVVGWTRQGDTNHGYQLFNGSHRTFDVPFAGATSTIGRGIDDTGRIVGTYKSPECRTGCGFLATPVSGTASCTQSLSLSYASNSLTLNFTVGTQAPATMTSYLVVNNAPIKLWALALPTVAPAVAFSYPISGLPPVGRVSAVSLLTASNGVTLCADIASIDTGH